MEFLLDFLTRFAAQLQSPTLGFLIGGAVLAALGSRLEVPDAIYKFIVFMLLMKIGLKGGMKIREADLDDMLLPALFAVLIGVIIVLLGRYTLAIFRQPDLREFTLSPISAPGADWCGEKPSRFHSAPHRVLQ
ncbi:hypothetical protein Thiowin_04727 [Thiorhodovibrio winogradskyi]|uniref:Uncharacterized protein n=2 Tax=Thiorhodovibrio winogradskyi TaxID=77007 RepID=A0ABZ0SGY8_9GAMM